MRDFTQTPITQRSLPSLDNLILNETDENFVDIFKFSNGLIKVNMQYAKAGISSAIPTAYVRETVAKKLLEALKLLPENYTFEILDAWRPYEVQLSLFNSYRERIIPSLPLTATEEEITKKVCEFVSYPDKSKAISYVHASGGAVDIRILDATGKPLDMGTQFDDFSERSYTAWYENNSDDKTVKENRRLLHNTLCECGFTNYPSEWWHYDFGDSFWSFYTQNEVIYTSKYEETDVINND